MTALLVLGLVGAALTFVSLWPPHWPGTVALGAFFVGWLVSELPLHFALLQLALASLFATHGGVHGGGDAIGLVLIGLILYAMLFVYR